MIRVLVDICWINEIYARSLKDSVKSQVRHVTFRMIQYQVSFQISYIHILLNILCHFRSSIYLQNAFSNWANLRFAENGVFYWVFSASQLSTPLVDDYGHQKIKHLLLCMSRSECSNRHVRIFSRYQLDF